MRKSARARLAAITQTAGAAAAFSCSIALLVMLDGHGTLLAWDGFLYVDPLGGFFAMTVAAVTLLAALGSIGYVAAQEKTRGQGRRAGNSAGFRSGCTSRSSACSRR